MRTSNAIPLALASLVTTICLCASGSLRAGPTDADSSYEYLVVDEMKAVLELPPEVIRTIEGIREVYYGAVKPLEVFLSLPYFDHMHRFLPALVRREGLRVVSVPVAHRPRLRGRSKYGVGDRLWAGIVDMAGVLWLQRRRRPAGPVSEVEVDGL